MDVTWTLAPDVTRTYALWLERQVVIAVLCCAFGYYVHVTSGLFCAFCLESIGFSTFLVSQREGTGFGVIAAGIPSLVFLVYSILLKVAYDQSWAFAITLGSGTALVCSSLMVLFVHKRGAIKGLQVCRGRYMAVTWT